jgi:hypothetical protein
VKSKEMWGKKTKIKNKNGKIGRKLAQGSSRIPCLIFRLVFLLPAAFPVMYS